MAWKNYHWDGSFSQNDFWDRFTLHVPMRLRSFVELRIECFGNMRSYFCWLFNKGRGLTHTKIPFNLRLTASYQKSGQSQTRLYFRASSYSWQLFKSFSRFHGFAMCHMFVILVEMDRNGEIVQSNTKDVRALTHQGFQEILALSQQKLTRRFIAYRVGKGPEP